MNRIAVTIMVNVVYIVSIYDEVINNEWKIVLDNLQVR